MAALALATGLLFLQPAAGFPGDNGGIAFTRGGQVWVMNADGTSPTALTSEGGSQPAFSADATKIAFIRAGDVYRMNSDGSDVVRLSTTGGTDPAWSPDGTKMAFTQGDQVAVMSADGTGVSPLTPGSDPAWSPDGDEIAFVQDGNVSVIGVEGGEATTLAPGSDPAWSPDGDQIVFVQDGDISVVAAAGGDVATLGPGADPAWSPEGTKIAFTQGTEVWAMGADGSSPAALTTDGGAEPDWGVGGAPTNISVPTVTGTAAFGSTLTASRGTWGSSSPIASYTYQWRRCDSAGANCAAITGATASSYTLTTADVGSTIQIAVTATNEDGPRTVESVATAIVTAPSGSPVNTSLPTLSGTAAVGAVLTSTTGAWSGTGITFTRAWLRCDAAAIDTCSETGATGTLYTVTSADLNSRLRVRVTATNSVGTATALSAASAVVVAASAPTNTVLPSIIGTPRVSSTLTALNGTWTSATGVTYSRQWQRCDASGGNCSDISGATLSTYFPTSSDLGSRLRVIVTATNAGGSTTATSAATTAIAAASTATSTTPTTSTTTAPRNTTLPRVTGTAVQGSTLTAAPGSWTGSAPITYMYQWERCDEEEDDCDEVAGATRSTYTLVSRDVGSRLRVVVTATNSRGDDVETSEATDVVKASSAVAAGSKPTPGSKPAAGKPKSSKAKGRTIRGTRRADVLLGGSGNDRILPGRGRDTVVAGAGNDVIAAADGARDVVICGAGRDRVVADRIDVLRGCEIVVRVRIATASQKKSAGKP